MRFYTSRSESGSVTCQLNLADEKFEDLCFDFGIELEEVTSELKLSERSSAGNSDRKIYRIDIPANRYDMLCVEGIARAISCYLELSKPPIYSLSTPVKLEQMFVQTEVGLY